MSEPLYDRLPAAINPLVNASIPRAAALAKLMHIFNAGYELGVMKAPAEGIEEASRTLFPENGAYSEFFTAGFVYGREGFTRNEAVEDFLLYKERGNCRLKARAYK